MLEVIEELQLFNPDDYPKGHLAYGLAENVRRNAMSMALNVLFRQPRYSYDIGHPDEERDMIFDSSRNTWTEWIGAMCCSMTASDIALGAARRYMTDVLGAGYFRFSHELTEIAEQVAVDYNAAYPPRELVRLEPGY